MIANKNLVFIVGSARSGTNWLRRLLSQSRNVATGPETHLFSSYLLSLDETWHRHQGTGVGLPQLISEDELAAWMRGFAELCLGRIAEGRPDARIVLEKTPKHGEHAADILRLFPKAFFIHIIRDPRAVVPSLRAASRSWGSTWAPGRLADACRKWRRDVANARTAGTVTERYCEVRYEELHADGPGEIMRLFAWLGEPVSREEAESYVAASAFEKVRPTVSSPEDVDAQFYRRGEVDSWRRELSSSDIAIIERLTRKQMAELGYEPVAGRRDQMIAEARLQAYRAANKFAKAVRAGADRIKP
jgi:hypothetical protein